MGSFGPKANKKALLLWQALPITQKREELHMGVRIIMDKWTTLLCTLLIQIKYIWFQSAMWERQR